MRSTHTALIAALSSALVFSTFAGADSAPPPPLFVKSVTVDLVGVTLSWAPPVETHWPEAYHFRVYRAVDGGPFALVAEVHALAFLDRDAPMDSPVTFAVTTVDADGVESAPVFHGNTGDSECVNASSGGAGVRIRECVN